MKKFFLVALAATFMMEGLCQDEGSETLFLTLEDALKIALSENVSVKIADRDIQRAQYALKGSYASLFPQVDGSASYQRTIKKQVMYMDFDIGAMTGGGGQGGENTEALAQNSDSKGKSPSGGIEVGRLNTYSYGVNASMPLINAQLWKGISISAQDVELAVEKARSSRLDMVTQVKQAFYSVLLAKQVLDVYTEVYDNAVENLRQTEMRYNVQKASELDYVRAKTSVSNAVPNMYDADNSVFLALWQLKAVMGIDLDTEIDVSGSLKDYVDDMFNSAGSESGYSLEKNSSLRQLGIQAEQLSNTIKMQKYASLPSLALTFAYTVNAMTNDFNFSEYHWSPYSYVGISLRIPVFSGGQRYNAVRQAKVQYEELQLQTLNAERQLRIAIQQYLSQMETGMKSYDSAESAVETARKAYDIASKSYNVGRGTLTDLNDAQLALTQAELGVSQAIFNFVTAKTNLEQTLGADFISE